MGASCTFFKEYKLHEHRPDFVVTIDADSTNHSYGGLSALINYLFHSHDLDFYEYMDYATYEKAFSLSKLEKQSELLKVLRETVLPKAEEEFKDQIGVLDGQYGVSGADGSPDQGAYFVAWIRNWIKWMEDGYYLGYTI